MALNLGMRKGNDVYVGDLRFRVVAIAPDCTYFALTWCGTKYTYHVSMDKWYEVVPGIKFKCGLPHQNDDTIVSMLIEAPRTINIVRGNKKRQEMKGNRNATS